MVPLSPGGTPPTQLSPTTPLAITSYACDPTLPAAAPYVILTVGCLPLTTY